MILAVHTHYAIARMDASMDMRANIRIFSKIRSSNG